MSNPLYGQNKTDQEIDNAAGKVIVATDNITLTAAQSGSTVFMNAAAKTIQLPSAEAGLRFKVIFGVATTAGADILADAGNDCFFGIVRLFSTTVDQAGVPQILTHADAVAAPGSYDTMDFVAATATIGGSAGDMVDLVAVDGTAWHVNASLTTSNSNPGAVAVIVGS